MELVTTSILLWQIRRSAYVEIISEWAKVCTRLCCRLLISKISLLQKRLLDIFYVKCDWTYRDNPWMSYVIKAVELLPFLLWRHTPSAILVPDFHGSLSWTEPNAEKSSKSTTLNSNKTHKSLSERKKNGTVIQSNKKFPITEKSRTPTGTLSVLYYNTHKTSMK